MPATTKSPFGVLVCLAALAASLAAQGKDLGFHEDMASALDELTVEHQRSPGDKALLEAWRLEIILAGFPAQAESAKHRERFATLVAGIDPCLAERQAARLEVGKRVRALARQYQDRKLFDLAAHTLLLLDRQDPAGMAADLAALTPPVAGKEHAAPVGAENMMLRPLSVQGGKWWYTAAGSLICPLVNAESAFQLSTGRHADHEILLDAAIPGRDGWLDLMLGAEDLNNCFTVGLHDRAVGGVCVEVHQFVDNAATKIGGFVSSAPADAEGFHRLVVRIRGQELEIELNGLALGRLSCPAKVAGYYGLMVSGNNVSRIPHLVRRMQAVPLRVDAAPAPEPWRVKDRRLELADASLDGAEALQKLRQHEAAVLMADHARADVAGLPPSPARDALRKRLDTVSALSDPLQAQRKAMGREVAKLLCGLADGYGAAGRPRAAAELVRQAARFDAAGVAARLAAAETELLRGAPVAPPAAPTASAGAGDDANSAVDLFGAERAVAGKGTWSVQPDEISLRGLPGAQWDCLPMQGGRFWNRLAAEVQLRPGVVAGFAFADPATDVRTVAYLRSGADRVWLEVAQLAGGRWQVKRSVLVASQVPADTWLSLRLQHGVASAQVSDGRTSVTLDGKLLGSGHAHPGLFIGNGGDLAVDVGLRSVRWQ